MSIVVDWNGTDFPEELRELPAGRYVVECVDQVRPLSDDEDGGLQDAMRSIARGDGLPAELARKRLESSARK